MGVQMNIKSPEARALAEKIAKRRGVSLTEAVVDSLKAADRALHKADRDARLAAFLDESRRLNADRERSEEDPTAFLYDEDGLPK
jgi:hypothetical protein